jgi:YHS domain-containing protein
MLRTVVELIVGLVIAYFIRSVLAILVKAFTGSASGPTGHTRNSQAANQRPGNPYAGAPAPPSSPQASELKKDPVCGTFVSTAVALQKNAGGQTYYFCSADCRDKFRV